MRTLRISITTRLLSYLLLAGIVPLILLGVSSFEISRRIIIKQAGEFHLQQITDLSAYLTLYSEQIESLAANVAGNEAIGEALGTKEAPGKNRTDSFATLSTHAKIGDILNGYVRVKGLVSIDLFSTDGKHFHIGDTLDVRDVDNQRVRAMLDEARNSPTPLSWRGIEDNLNQASTQKKVQTVTRVIRYFVPESGKAEVVGLLVINIDTTVVINAFLKDVKTSNHLQLMLLDRNGRFIYHSKAALVGQDAAPELISRLRSGPSIQALQLDGEEVILAFVADRRAGGVLAGTLPRSVLTAPTAALIYAGLALLLVCLIAWGAASSWGARNAHVGPDPETMPARAPASRPASSSSPRWGCSDRAAGSRSLTRCSATRRTSPDASPSSRAGGTGGGVGSASGLSSLMVMPGYLALKPSNMPP